MTLQKFLNDAKSKVEKATPGPWTQNESRNYIVNCEDDDEMICRATARDDAALIASAPETILKLVEVCEVLRSEADRILRNPVYTSQIAITAWDSALAKAELIVKGEKE